MCVWGGCGWVWVEVWLAVCKLIFKISNEEFLELRKVYYSTSHALMHMYTKYLGSC